MTGFVELTVKVSYVVVLFCAIWAYETRFVELTVKACMMTGSEDSCRWDGDLTETDDYSIVSNPFYTQFLSTHC